MPLLLTSSLAISGCLTVHTPAGIPPPPASTPWAPPGPADAGALAPARAEPPTDDDPVDCPAGVACTDRHIAETLIYDAGRACVAEAWDRCATLASRARDLDPSASTAAHLQDIAVRRRGVVTPTRVSPGFLNRLFMLTAGVWIGGLGAQPNQVMPEIYAGRRFGAIGKAGILQLDGGLALGSFAPYTLTQPAVDPDLDGMGDAPTDQRAFGAPRFGLGPGARFTVGFSVRTGRRSAIEFVWVPGVRVVASVPARADGTMMYLDLGTGPAFHYGRLRWEILAQISTGSPVTDGKLSPLVFGIGLRTSLGLGGNTMNRSSAR